MREWFGIDYFEQPEALLLLLLLPLYWYWYERYFRKQRLVIRLSYDPEQLQKPRFRLTWMRMLPRIFQMLALLLLILAVARPQRSRELRPPQAQGADVMVLLDVSRSMEQDDIAPSRFKAAKLAVTNLFEDRPDERFGVVVFGPAALSLAPLTHDHAFLTDLIERTESDLLAGQGTALGPAIGVGLNRLRDSDASRRMMIIFSDGGANGGDLDPVSAARLAATRGIPVHCVYIGSQGDGPDRNAGLMQQVAALSGGSFLRAASRSAMLDLWESLNIELPRTSNRAIKMAEDRYPVFVMAAIVLLALAYLLMLSAIYNPLEQ